MPVTARLSKKFYDRFGDEIANELVDWFNQVDATYRHDLERLNELNFRRFDAKVEQRFAEFEARWGRRYAELETAVDRRLAEMALKIEQAKSELTWKMFGFWAGTVIPLAGLMIALRVL